jgi:hypothetical protein
MFVKFSNIKANNIGGSSYVGHPPQFESTWYKIRKKTVLLLGKGMTAVKNGKMLCSLLFLRPNRVGNQFYDDKPNGSCYMDWNENFLPTLRAEQPLICLGTICTATGGIFGLLYTNGIRGPQCGRPGKYIDPSGPS